MSPSSRLGKRLCLARASWSSLVWLTPEPWSWRRHFPPKCLLTFNGLLGNISLRMEMFCSHISGCHTEGTQCQSCEYNLASASLKARYRQAAQLAVSAAERFMGSTERFKLQCSRRDTLIARRPAQLVTAAGWQPKRHWRKTGHSGSLPTRPVPYRVNSGGSFPLEGNLAETWNWPL
jgi:hypothetical protein